jgi:hypothetical protein
MPPRSRSKAFRNAILWTWWLPLLAAAAVSCWWYHQDKNMSDEYIAVGKIAVVLPSRQAPDEATMQAHVSLLESSTIAEHATVRTRETHPELRPPTGHLVATGGKGGIINIVATGFEDRGPQIYLNEGLAAYIDTVEFIRRHGSSAGEKLNPQAVPVILELAGPAIAKRKEFVLPMGLLTLGGGVAGLVLMLLISGVWAFFRPASTQPSLDEMVKAAAGLDDISRSVLVEWLKGRVGNEVSADHAA